jgi:hypothetical protein
MHCPTALCAAVLNQRTGEHRQLSVNTQHMFSLSLKAGSHVSDFHTHTSYASGCKGSASANKSTWHAPESDTARQPNSLSHNILLSTHDGTWPSAMHCASLHLSCRPRCASLVQAPYAAAPWKHLATLQLSWPHPATQGLWAPR